MAPGRTTDEQQIAVGRVGLGHVLDALDSGNY